VARWKKAYWGLAFLNYRGDLTRGGWGGWGGGVGGGGRGVVGGGGGGRGGGGGGFVVGGGGGGCGARSTAMQRVPYMALS